MKAYIKILLVMVIVGGLISWIRNSSDFGHIARTLPFCGGRDVPLPYTIGSIFLLLLLFWGFRRLKNLDRDDDDQPDDNHEGYYEEDHNEP